MKYKIKETCKCGAVMEYEEEIREFFERGTSFRHSKFLEAHKVCRENQPPNITTNYNQVEKPKIKSKE